MNDFADNVRMVPEEPNFLATARELDAYSPSVSQFTIKAGPAFAGKWYLVLSGYSGCHPGFNLNGVHVPLNPDPWTMMCVDFALQGIWSGFYAQLDGAGEGTAVFDTFTAQPAAAGLALYFVYVVLQNPANSPIFASFPIYVLFR